jgi:hypothetical protein
MTVTGRRWPKPAIVYQHGTAQFIKQMASAYRMAQLRHLELIGAWAEWDGMDGYSFSIDFDEAERRVAAWREANPDIVRMWE